MTELLHDLILYKNQLYEHRSL